MKTVLPLILAIIMAATLVGCEDYEEQPLEFHNSSSHIVTVTSLSIEWVGFSIAPGQTKNLSGIRDVDYEYEPKEYVQEGSASTGRFIVFVDAPKE